jgi:hypothetical protein
MRIFLIKNFGDFSQNFSEVFWSKKPQNLLEEKHGSGGKNAKNGILNFKVSCQFKHLQKSPGVFASNLIQVFFCRRWGAVFSQEKCPALVGIS